jgi:transposase
LAQQVISLAVVMAEQAKTIDKLSLEIVELRARLGMNSRNSSKPPSSDGYEKPAPKSRRVRSGNKAGKQKGEPGHHLAQRADPDDTVIHPPKTCASCGEDLSDAAVSGIITRQVFDLPPVALFCTEHQVQRRRCACGAESTGTFPNEATAPACYGPALRAYVCYLVTRQHIPIARVAELVRDTYGQAISTATIITMVNEGAAMLDEFLTQVRDLLRQADVAHADETGLRVEAHLAWVHAVSTEDLTLYHLDAERGKPAMDAMGVIEHLRGVLVHDGWASYRRYEHLTHGACNAHHLRELEAAGSTEGQGWAADMAELLATTWHLVLEAKTADQHALGPEVLAEVRKNYASIIAAGHAANPPVAPSGKRGRTKRTKAHNLLLRLDTYEDDVLRFAADFAVPFDNNLCERDVRMIKIAQKISGGFRTTEGAEAFLALRSYLSTAAKQGMHRLEVLQQLFNGDTWMPAAPCASP